MENMNTEITKKQKDEAISRIKKLNLHPNAVREFIEENKLNLSERGMLYWLDETELDMIDEWQKETGNLVYHVIKNNMEFGLCYSLLYVSVSEDEWEDDNYDLDDGYPLVFVMNVDDEFCSEYGSIGIKPFMGGVIRTA